MLDTNTNVKRYEQMFLLELRKSSRVPKVSEISAQAL